MARRPVTRSTLARELRRLGAVSGMVLLAGALLGCAGPDAPSLSTLTLALDGDWTPGAELELGALVDLDVAPDGRVVLLDAMAARILVLAPGGDLLASFGGPGGGPGEFEAQALSRIVLMEGEAGEPVVAVPDVWQSRISVFDLDGTLLRTVPIPLLEGLPIDWRRGPERSLEFRLVTFVNREFVLRLRDGELDTLATLPHPEFPHNTLVPPVALWDRGEDGSLYLGRSDQGDIRAEDPTTGAVRWSTRLFDSPHPFTDEDRRALEDLLVASEEAFDAGTPLSPEGRARLLAIVHMPPSAPVFAALHHAEPQSPELASEIWVQHALPVPDLPREALLLGRADGYGGPEWTVLTGEGSVLRKVRLPEHFTPTRFLGGWIYGYRTSSMGERFPARVQRPR